VATNDDAGVDAAAKAFAEVLKPLATPR